MIKQGLLLGALFGLLLFGCPGAATTLYESGQVVKLSGRFVMRHSALDQP